ncbi:hypothetical protein FGG08_002679 [Glutinoglossum americanum]|uniref:HAD-like protein n=1 Tax=Glutinoglossum americanum TaxID=1670608 RepID=A0A9P8ICH5_9PEZI|nr:hypothetical protein FGG08_002679 [Glutinoglossum americanum]
MTILKNITTLILDLGDVLFNWSPPTKTKISPITLRRIFLTPTWSDYECGKISRDACYQRIGEQFCIDPSEVASTFAQARETLSLDSELMLSIQQLKIESNNTLRVYAMSNISEPDYQFLRTKPMDWSIFDQVFTSCAVGERKPNLAFYQHVLDATRADPQSTIFVDDKTDNVLSARSMGLHGIVYDNKQQVVRALRNLLGNPVKRGEAFLERNSKNLLAESDNSKSYSIHENFCQLLILEATNNRDIVEFEEYPRTWNFFKDKQLVSFPHDLDTTAVALTVLEREEKVVHSILDEMMTYQNVDGIILTYFDHTRPRLDPAVCANVLSLFYLYGRGHQLTRTFQWVCKVLLNRAYLDGTRYYCTPECFLWFVSRMIRFSGSPEVHQQLNPLLRDRVQERIGASGDAMALAMRILVCKSVGIRNEVDARSLLPLQCEDGGWELGWMYKHPTTLTRVGSRGLTTALAINAIKAIEGYYE